MTIDDAPRLHVRDGAADKDCIYVHLGGRGWLSLRPAEIILHAARRARRRLT